MLVVIDPGHGGHDKGAVVAGVEEARINLHVALMLRTLLDLRGYDALLTRTDHDTFVGLPERATLANRAGADCFVSIHCNAWTTHEPNGFEVFYHPDGDHTLASELALAKARAFPEQKLRRGEVFPAKKANYAVLRLTRMPAALAELGFLTHPESRRWLQEPANQLLCAEALMDGILMWRVTREKAV